MSLVTVEQFVAPVIQKWGFVNGQVLLWDVSRDDVKGDDWFLGPWQLHLGLTLTHQVHIAVTYVVNLLA